MIRYGSPFVRRGGAVRALASLAALGVLAACSLTSGPDDKPTTARVRVEGTSPHALVLVVSHDFFEQINLNTGARDPIVVDADTFQIALPFDQTFDLGGTGSVYVKVHNLLVPTASIRLRVNLDGGQSYDQSATLSDDASLTYYFLFDDYTF